MPKSIGCTRLVVVACSGVVVSAWAQAHDMVEVGLVSGQTRLAAHFDIHGAIPLDESFIGNVPGWAGAELGFAAMLFDDPIEGLLKLPDDCDVRVKVVGYTPGLWLWNNGTTAALNAGESYSLGEPYFHHHPIWQIDQPGFGQVFNVELVLEDALGNYAASEPFTVGFTPVPTPGAAGVLGLAGVMGLRRRR